MWQLNLQGWTSSVLPKGVLRKKYSKAGLILLREGVFQKVGLQCAWWCCGVVLKWDLAAYFGWSTWELHCSGHILEEWLSEEVFNGKAKYDVIFMPGYSHERFLRLQRIFVVSWSYGWVRFTCWCFCIYKRTFSATESVWLRQMKNRPIIQR